MSFSYLRYQKSFARLFNGQGWIPRCLGEMSYATEVGTPDIRLGSFWFRVQSSNGVDVRHGPSPSAPLIKSDCGTSFRFECGEFLRASEIITIFDKADVSEQKKDAVKAECFAKLYRKNRGFDESDSSQSLLNRYSSLQSLTLPGEWVQIHGNGELYLEECSIAPTFERFREGWGYRANQKSGVKIRRGPSFRAGVTGKVICAGEDFLVTEKVIAYGDQVTWLRLRNGEGWVHDVEESGEAVVQPHSLPNQTDNPDNDAEYSQRMVRQILHNRSHPAHSLQ